MQRNRLEFFPKFDGPIKGWAINYINKQLWRMDSYIEFDDLLQDAFEYFLQVKKKYPDVDNPRHFMSLFQSCLRNHFHDLAKQRQRHITIEDYCKDTSSEEDMDMLLLEFAECPQLVHELALVLNNKDTPDNVERKTTNEYWCGLLNLDPAKINLRGLVKQHLAK